MRKIIVSDAICVKFLTPSLLIYGKGNQLIIRSTFQEILTTRPYDKIHRISFLKLDDNAFSIACSAGREILVTKIVNGKFQEAFITKFNDWISSIEILYDGSIAAVTSHNFAMLLSVEDNKLVVKEKLRCDDNSTLYCSHIHGRKWNELTFFAGTALGELIIWKSFNSTPRTLFQKSLHNGVVFSIDYNHNFLITTSDDRSIKIYIPDENWILTELRQCFGHTSRVFACKVIMYENNFLFLSAGEDANLCIWNEDGKLLKKRNVNASGGIWGVDYDSENAIIVTSSSNGKLNRFKLRETLYENFIKDFMSSQSEKVEPTKLKFLANGTLCVLDNRMQIFTHNESTNEWLKVSQHDATHQKGVALESWENRLMLMTGNSILIFDYDIVDGKLKFTFEFAIHEKFSLQFDYFRALHTLNFHQVFISDANGNAAAFDLRDEKLMNAFKIPKSSEPWTTAVARVDRFWLIADRLGSLYLFDGDASDDVDGIFKNPIQKLSRLHSAYVGVKMIRILSDGFIMTTGNDGTVKKLYLDKEKAHLSVYQTFRTPVKWIERISTLNNIEHILGFNDNYFVISRCDDDEIIYEHSCGGRHRRWDCSLIKSEEDDCKMRLAYIKRKQVNCVEFYLNASHFEDDGILWHTRVCNVIEMIDDVKILVSGGEDTIIKLFKVDMMNDDVSLKRIADVNSHISSIMTMMMWKCEESGDLLIVSAGGRAQIVVTRLMSLKYAKEETNFMLTNSMALGKSKESTFDPETRLTCLDFDLMRKILFVGCSDGYLRAFELYENSLKLKHETFYGRCIQKVKIIENFVLTMTTDGKICFYRFESEKAILIEKLQHNRNGINSFDVFPLSKNRFRIATGGDDCGIYVTDFEIDGNSVTLSKTINCYSAHIAQVTGVKFSSPNIIYSVSIDQTICKLKVDEGIDVIRVKRTCVADAKGFKFYGDFIFVYGNGLEMIKKF